MGFKNLILILLTVTTFTSVVRASDPASEKCKQLVEALDLPTTEKENTSKWNVLTLALDRINGALKARSERERAKIPVTEKEKRAKEAITPFKAYVDSLNNSYLESDYVIDGLLRGMISMRPVVLAGFTGTGKSAIVDAIAKNIIFSASMKDNFSTQLVMPKRDIRKTRAEQIKDAEAAAEYMSYFKYQITSETRLSHVFGGVIMKEQMESGARRFYHQQGAQSHVFAFFDEIGDGQAEFLRGTLNYFNEGVVSEGDKHFESDTLFKVAATNYSVQKTYEKAEKNGIDLAAHVDRMAAIILLPKNFADRGDLGKGANNPNALGSNVKMMKAALNGADKNISKIRFEDLLAIMQLVEDVKIPDAVLAMQDKVIEKLDEKLTLIQDTDHGRFITEKKTNSAPEPAYRKTHLYSKRSIAHYALQLRTAVVMDWVKHGGNRPLVANYMDIVNMRDELILSGPNNANLEKVSSLATTDPSERPDFATLKIERQAFVDSWHEIVTDMEVTIQKFVESMEHDSK